MAKILVNDGIHPVGAKMLEEAGHELFTTKVGQEDLAKELPKYDAICIRSATKVRADVIDVCPNLKAIARGGVGLDNVDVDHAKAKGISVINTPGASSRSVAELTFGHIFSIARSIYLSNRAMPSQGVSEFGKLKKAFGGGMEIQGKTLGIIGFGKIGQETAQLALGTGMNVMAVDPFVKTAELTFGGPMAMAKYTIVTSTMDEVLSQADIITLHLPFLGKPVLSTTEFNKMKDGVVLINCARGGTVDETALLSALESGKVAAAGLDVFENEPTPQAAIIEHPKVSLTPHTGAATKEAQVKIGIELAEKLIAVFT